MFTLCNLHWVCMLCGYGTLYSWHTELHTERVSSILFQGHWLMSSTKVTTSAFHMRNARGEGGL